MQIFVFSVLIISGLENQSKFLMFTRGTPIWRFHTGLCKFCRVFCRDRLPDEKLTIAFAASPCGFFREHFAVIASL